MISRALYIFLQGVVLGVGPCFFICGPVLLPFVVGTRKNFKEGLKATGWVLGGKVLVYTMLGALFGTFGYWAQKVIFASFYTNLMWTAAGLILIVFGVFIALGEKTRVCPVLREKAILHSNKGLFTLGVLIGLTPCLPLMGILTEIALISNRFWQGAFYGLSFGFGTALSPLLIAGVLLPWLSGFIKTEVFVRVIEIVSGILVTLVGIYLIVLHLGLV